MYYGKIIEEIEKIKNRNKRVELDKKWEICWTRRIYICILTHIVVVFYSFLIREYDNIFLNLCAPVIGFILSTLSLKVVRKICESRIK